MKCLLLQCTGEAYNPQRIRRGVIVVSCLSVCVLLTRIVITLEISINTPWADPEWLIAYLAT